MSEQQISISETLWLIAYDVESENSAHLTEKQRDWLRTQRVAIWYALRYRYKCVPIQHSVWLIRDENIRDVLEKRKEDWLQDYKKGEFSARIEIFPIQTNEVGYKTFKNWEFDFILEWLGKIEKALVKAREVGKITKKAVQTHTRKLELLGNILNEDFTTDYPNWRTAQDSLGVVQDLLNLTHIGGA